MLNEFHTNTDCMNIFDKILQDEIFQQDPPVLVDIGAATRLCGKWSVIGKYSVCIAFDPDLRQMDYIEKEDSRFRRLCFFPQLVHDSINGEVDFYLTASPECSSCLEPDTERLRNWNIAPFFQVTERRRMKSVTLPEVMRRLNLARIDALKSDSQGMDLRLLASLDETVRQNILALEVEPGLIDAYKGEDKFWMLLEYMGKTGGFRMSDCRVEQLRYLPAAVRDRYFTGIRGRLVNTLLPGSPGWCETAFLNDYSKIELTERNCRLGWIMAMIDRQYGFALELAGRGEERFGKPIYRELAACTLKKMPFWRPVLRKCCRKFLKF